MQYLNRLYIRHFESINHFVGLLHRHERTRRNRPIPFRSKWLVLKRPRLAGFQRPLTKCNMIVKQGRPRTSCDSSTVLPMESRINWHCAVPALPLSADIPGKDCRFIPLFPELRRPLLDVFEQAQSSESRVITRYHGGSACNLRTHMTRIVRRAGLEMWPKPFHNMRASRQTELAESYPLHVVCAWIGNSKAVAAEHYLQITDAHFARAIQAGEQAQQNPQHEVQQNAQQQVQASKRNEVNGAKKSLENRGFTRYEAQGGINLPIPPTTPNRIRTGVCRLRICRPGPLDDGGQRLLIKCMGAPGPCQIILFGRVKYHIGLPFGFYR